MAAGDSKVLTTFAHFVLNDYISNTATAVKVALLDSGWTPAPDTDEFWDDISTHEISVSGYTAGGQAIGSGSVTQDDANDRSEYDGADPSWTFAASVSPAYAVLYDDTGTPATSRLIEYWELAGGSVTGTYTLTVNTEGLLQARATAQSA